MRAFVVALIQVSAKAFSCSLKLTFTATHEREQVAGHHERPEHLHVHSEYVGMSAHRVLDNDTEAVGGLTLSRNAPQDVWTGSVIAFGLDGVGL